MLSLSSVTDKALDENDKIILWIINKYFEEGGRSLPSTVGKKLSAVSF